MLVVLVMALIIAIMIIMMMTKPTLMASKSSTPSLLLLSLRNSVSLVACWLLFSALTVSESPFSLRLSSSLFRRSRLSRCCRGR